MQTNPVIAPETAQALIALLSAATTAKPATGVPGATTAEDEAFAKRILEKQAERKATIRKAAKKMAKEMYENLSEMPVGLAVRELKAIGDTMRWSHLRTRDHLDYLEREMHKLRLQGVDPNGTDHADHLVDDVGAVVVDQSTSLYKARERAAERDTLEMEWAELRMYAAEIALGYANMDAESAYGPPANGIPPSIDTDISDSAFMAFKRKDQANREKRRLESIDTTPAANAAIRATTISSSLMEYLDK